MTSPCQECLREEEETTNPCNSKREQIRGEFGEVALDTFRDREGSGHVRAFEIRDAQD